MRLRELVDMQPERLRMICRVCKRVIKLGPDMYAITRGDWPHPSVHDPGCPVPADYVRQEREVESFKLRVERRVRSSGKLVIAAR
jgi:hypothetical protein